VTVGRQAAASASTHPPAPLFFLFCGPDSTPSERLAARNGRVQVKRQPRSHFVLLLRCQVCLVFFFAAFLFGSKVFAKGFCTFGMTFGGKSEPTS
jgi:hypothetical protein